MPAQGPNNPSAWRGRLQDHGCSACVLLLHGVTNDCECILSSPLGRICRDAGGGERGGAVSGSVRPPERSALVGAAIGVGLGASPADRLAARYRRLGAFCPCCETCDAISQSLRSGRAERRPKRAMPLHALEGCGWVGFEVLLHEICNKSISLYILDALEYKLIICIS